MKIFVTGASGWIGSALVPELITNGHQVVGLARSDESAQKLKSAGAEVVRGTIDDIDLLKSTAATSDGVIHLAFKHDIAFSGDFAGAALADRQAVEAFGEALTGSNKPFAIASGVLFIAEPGHVATEKDGLEATEASASVNSGPATRLGTAHVVLALADKGVRSSVIRLAPTVHGQGDNGFVATLTKIAKETGKAGYIGDGSSRWPAVHRLDAARLFRLAIERAPASSVLHAVAEEGVPTKDIAEAIGRGFNIPAVSISPKEAIEYFSFLARFIGVDSPASSEATRKLLNWEPTHPSLIDDLDQGYYFKN
jgi:nucleoside-diphosphate-sugar epimerase